MKFVQLHEKEELFALVRSSLLWRAFICTVLVFGLALPCLFFFSIRSFGIELVLFNIAVFIALGFIFSRAIRSLYKTVIVVTNERVVVRRVPWFGKEEEESILLNEVDLEVFPRGAILFPASMKTLRALITDLRAV